MTLPAWLLDVDFSCAPSRRKPIVAAWGRRDGAVVKLDELQDVPTLDGFAELVSASAPKAGTGWIGGFDFPFGLPRLFIDALDPALANQGPRGLIEQLHARCGTRQGFQALVDGWGRDWGQGTRPASLPHRHTDTATAGIASTSPLQTRYVPVGKMYFEGFWRLVQAGVPLPGLDGPWPGGSDRRAAFEAYPGLLAHEILGRQSYKSDAGDGRDAARLLQRLSLIDALTQGRTRLGVRLRLSTAQREHLAADAQGDRVDAVLCLMQAAWAHARMAYGDLRGGVPDGIDPVEGWILTA